MSKTTPAPDCSLFPIHLTAEGRSEVEAEMQAFDRHVFNPPMSGKEATKDAEERVSHHTAAEGIGPYVPLGFGAGQDLRHEDFEPVPLSEEDRERHMAKLSTQHTPRGDK